MSGPRRERKTFVQQMYSKSHILLKPSILYSAVGVLIGLYLLGVMAFVTQGKWTAFLIAGILLLVTFGFVKDVLQFCIILLIMSLPVAADVRIYYDGFNQLFLTLSDCFLVLIIIVAFFKKSFHKKSFTRNLTLPAPVLLLMVCILVTTVAANYKLMAFFEYLNLLRALLTFVIIYAYIEDQKKVETVIRFLLLGLFLQTVLAICQYVNAGFFGLTFLGEGYRTVDEGNFSAIRVGGTVGHPTALASYLILLLPLCFRTFSEAKIRANEKILASVTFILGLLALGLTFGRGAWAGFLVGFPFLILSYLWKRIVSFQFATSIVICLIIPLVFTVVFNESLASKISERKNTFSGDLDDRIVWIKDSVELIRQHPILGIGPGNYGKYMERFYPAKYEGGRVVHNLYLYAAAETGIPGLVLFLIFLTGAFLQGIIHISKHGRFTAVVIAILCGVVSFLIADMVSVQYRDYNVKSLFWLCLAILYAVNKKDFNEIQMSEL